MWKQDCDSPFPEEMNRVLVSQLAQFHFAPTEGARENLIAAGINPKHITVTGNTIVDALHIANDLIQAHAPVIEGLPEGLTGETSTSRVVLVTGHRRENFGEEFENICEALLSLANKYPDVAFIYPVHLNPNIREPAHRILGKQNNIYLLAPQSYLPFVALLSRSHIVLTDSGGIQEEAPSLCKPVLVMRDTTERPEGIEAGAAKLVGTSKPAIVNAVSHLLEDDAEYTRMAHATNPYGDGRASERIIEVLNAAALVPA